MQTECKSLSVCCAYRRVVPYCILNVGHFLNLEWMAFIRWVCGFQISCNWLIAQSSLICRSNRLYSFFTADARSTYGYIRLDSTTNEKQHYKDCQEEQIHYVLATLYEWGMRNRDKKVKCSHLRCVFMVMIVQRQTDLEELKRGASTSWAMKSWNLDIGQCPHDHNFPYPSSWLNSVFDESWRYYKEWLLRGKQWDFKSRTSEVLWEIIGDGISHTSLTDTLKG